MNRDIAFLAPLFQLIIGILGCMGIASLFILGVLLVNSFAGTADFAIDAKLIEYGLITPTAVLP